MSKEIQILREYTCFPFREIKESNGAIHAELSTLIELHEFFYCGFHGFAHNDFVSYFYKNIVKTESKEQPVHGKMINLTISFINARRKSPSDTKLNGDLIDEMAVELPQRENERNKYFGLMIKDMQKGLNKLKNNFIDLLTENKNPIAKAEAFIIKTDSYINNLLKPLLFFPGINRIQKNQAKEHLHEFLIFLEGIARLPQMLTILPSTSLFSKFLWQLYSPLFSFYFLAKDHTQQYLDINMPLHKDYDFCLFLIRAHLHASKEKHSLGIHDIEIILIFLKESIQQSAKPDSEEDLSFIDYFAFLMYSHYGIYKSALIHYDNGAQGIFKLFSIDIKNFPLIPRTDPRIFINLLYLFKFALKNKFYTKLELKTKLEAIIRFLSKIKHDYKSLIHKSSERKIELELMVKLINQEIDYIIEDLRIYIHPQTKSATHKIAKKTSQITKTPFPEYSMYEPPLHPAEPDQNIFSALNPPPPLVTVRISDEEKTAKKIQRRKAFRQKTKTTLKKTLLDAPTDLKAPEEKLKTYMLKNPLNHAIIKASIQFKENFSEAMAEYLISILEKGKIGLNHGQIKPVGSEERQKLNNSKICMKLKGKFQGESIRYYADWDRTTDGESYLFFRYVDTCPHHGSKTKYFGKS